MKSVSSEAEFKSLVQDADSSGKLVVVDFFAEWCGPCKVLSPFLQQLSTEHKEAIFLKVDVDALESLSAGYGISAMPTIILLKGGQEVGRIVGANSKEIKAQVEKHSTALRATTAA